MTSDEQAMEIEANAFAMELLMPEHLMREAIGTRGVDVEDEKRVAALAKKFRVSVPVMVLRIGELMGRYRDDL